MSPLYWMGAARSPEQLAKMQELEAAGICVFCRENFDEYHEKPILMERDFWYVTENDYPYKGSRLHLLLIPQKHVSGFHELPAQAGFELFEILNRLKMKYGYPSEALIGRSGDMRRNGGSVEHLHLHYIVGNTDNLEHEEIRFKVSSQFTDKQEPPDR